MSWVIDKTKTTKNVLELKYDDGSKMWNTGEDEEKDGVPIFPYQATCKWDGCIHFNAYSNGYGSDHECENEECPCLVEYRHICDIDFEIKMLQELKEKAKEYFKDEEEWK